MKNHIYLCNNDYIDHCIQKGFWLNISGTIEHTETLTLLINNSRNEQKNLVVCLIHRFTVSNPLFTYHNNFEQNVVKL